MDILEAISSLGLFGTGLSQHARLFTLASAQDRSLPESLMAEKFIGREAVNELFTFDVDALSVSTDLDLNLLLGEELTIAPSWDWYASCRVRQHLPQFADCSQPSLFSKRAFSRPRCSSKLRTTNASMFATRPLHFNHY